MGSRRDIPLGSEIHPTVALMGESGILHEREMPKLGGEQTRRDGTSSWSFFSFFKKKSSAQLPSVQGESARE